jgi:hypothetical protein
MSVFQVFGRLLEESPADENGMFDDAADQVAGIEPTAFESEPAASAIH